MAESPAPSQDETPKALLRERIRGLEERNAELQRLHRELEDHLLQGQKLQILGQLLAALAHEINNPLSFVLVNLQLLQDRLPALEGADAGPRAAALREFETMLADSKEGAARIRDLVKNLREFAHVDPGELRPTDLGRVVEDALRLCWNEVKQHAGVVRRFGRPPQVECQPTRLGQVFVNLFLNAAQAIEEAGRRRGEIVVSISVEGPWAVVSVRDDGCGIAAENLTKVFQPFFTTKAAGRGMGLGLYIAQKIVAAHGGSIEASSEPGKGTDFRVSLPAYRG
jgi:signal transduction histidine kinase